MTEDKHVEHVQAPAQINPDRKSTNVSKISFPASLSHVSKIIIESRAKAANATGFGKVVHFFLSYQIPIFLIFGIFIGLIFPQPGTYLANKKASTYILIIIFFISGIGLKTDELRDMVNHKMGVIIGFLATSIISPLLSFIILAINYTPMSFPLGLTILMCGPSALSSGVVLTDIAGGNSALALLITMDANIFGVILEPYLLSVILNSFKISVSLDIPKLLLKIFYTLIAPLIVGKLFSYIPRVPFYYNKYKVFIKLLSNFCLIMIPWMDVSKSSKQILNISGVDILYCIGMGLFSNVLLAICNIVCCYVSCIPVSDAKAIIFVGSGKSIPGAVNILEFMPDEIMDKGLSVIPMLVTYLLSIFTNSFACSMWVKYEQRHNVPQEMPRPLYIDYEDRDTQPIFVDRIDDLSPTHSFAQYSTLSFQYNDIIKIPTFVELLTTLTGETM